MMGAERAELLWSEECFGEFQFNPNIGAGMCHQTGGGVDAVEVVLMKGHEEWLDCQGQSDQFG